MAKKHLQHIKSSQANKIPTAADLMYGEIAVNYANGSERLFIKNSDDEIVPFLSAKVIEENELAIAAGMAQLNEDIEAVEEIIENSNNCEEVTYSQLVSKVNQGGLVPGKYYKIIDYRTTTSQTDTQSANNDICIIVLALSSDKLSENAHATQKTGDTYFLSSKLSAWELKYCLENDTDRFAWADDTNGKGVIYYMKDEWGNECPYDFKNIQFKRNLTDGDLDIDNGTATWVFTFNFWDSGSLTCKDASIVGNTYHDDEGMFPGVYGNRIGSLSSQSVDTGSESSIMQFSLPDNVFLTDGQPTEYYGCYLNILGGNCYSNTFEDEPHDNTLGEGCNNNIFVGTCQENVLGKGCNYNVLNTSSNNTLSSGCTYNTLSANCNYNAFGNGSSNNTLGQSSDYNAFGSNSSHNTLVDHCEYIMFEDGCSHNTLNTSYSQNIIIERTNRYISITSTQATSRQNRLCNITIAQGVNSTNATKLISHNTVNDTFRTVYQPANSVTVSV